MKSTHNETHLHFLFISSDFVLIARSNMILYDIILGRANPVDCRQSSVGMRFTSIIERRNVSYLIVVSFLLLQMCRHYLTDFLLGGLVLSVSFFFFTYLINYNRRKAKIASVRTYENIAVTGINVARSTCWASLLSD